MRMKEVLSQTKTQIIGIGAFWLHYISAVINMVWAHRVLVCLEQHQVGAQFMLAHRTLLLVACATSLLVLAHRVLLCFEQHGDGAQ